jgi:hypothetical protein
MKKLYISLSLVIVTLFAVGQVTKKIGEVKNADSIQLRADHKLLITNVTEADKNIFSIHGEGNSTPASIPPIKYDKTRETLSIDFTDLFKSAGPEITYFLTTEAGVSVEVFQSRDVTEDPVTPPSPNKPIEGYTGIAFWDARSIINLWKNPGGNRKKLIRQYVNNYSGKQKTWDEIKVNDFFKESPVFTSIITSTIAESQSTKSNVSSPNILGSLGALDVTKYVQAFADFLRDRIKEELTVAYLQKLKAMIEASTELQYLLPKTRSVFLSSDPFAIPNMGPTYKAAFAEDLENLVSNFEKMVKAEDAYAALRASDAFIGFMTAYHFADMSARNYHPADILKTLSGKFVFEGVNSPKTSYAIAILNMFSQNILDTSGKTWISKNQLRNLSRDELYIFLGLLYEKYPVVFDAKIGSKSLKDIFTADGFTKSVDKIFDLLVIANAVDERIKAFKESQDKKESILTYFLNNADALLELVDYAVDLANIEPVNKKDYYKWKSVIEHALEATKAIKTNDMGKLGINVILVIDELVPEDKTWKKNLAEFIKFLTDVSNAKTSEDIKVVLNHYAAPVHSYRVARTASSSASIAAYPGVYGGLEYNSKGSSTAGTFGITAPIGFAFSWNTKKQASNSIFISLVDIGAALSYRFNNDTTDLPQKIYLGQIFSPGIAHVRGFKNSPLALKYGVQYAPLLRTIKDGNNVYTNAGVWRFSIAMTVDIPLLILSQKK